MTETLEGEVLITYSLIGCGRISTNHIKAAVMNRLNISAVCDIVPEKIEAVLAQHSIERDKAISRYTDYKKMLTEKQPQLVAIATNSGSHAQIALDCIESGCHVIIEKPIALSIADADAIIKCANKKGVLVCACHQNRFNISMQHFRSAIEQGRFGKLSTVVCMCAGIAIRVIMSKHLGVGHGCRTAEL